MKKKWMFLPLSLLCWTMGCGKKPNTETAPLVQKPADKVLAHAKMPLPALAKKLFSEDQLDISKGQNEMAELMERQPVAEETILLLAEALVASSHESYARQLLRQHGDHARNVDIADAVAQKLDRAGLERFGLLGCLFRVASADAQPAYFRRVMELLHETEKPKTTIMDHVADTGILRAPYVSDAHRNMVLELAADETVRISEMTANEIAIEFDAEMHRAVLVDKLPKMKDLNAYRAGVIFARDPVVVAWWKNEFNKEPLEFIADEKIREQVKWAVLEPYTNKRRSAELLISGRRVKPEAL